MPSFVSSLPVPLHPLYNDLQTKLADLPCDPVLSDELVQVALGSDFVLDQLLRKPDLLTDLHQSGDLKRLYEPDTYTRLFQAALVDVTEETALFKALRQLRQREMVRIIWRDLTRQSSMQDTTRELSWLADAAIDAALGHLYRWGCERWGTPIARDENGDKVPQQLVVLGMGKLGANELNLSSDIDLIFCFPRNGETEGARKCLANQDFFIRLGQKLIQALDTLNADGFVFRVDMRLRPFGSASPLACSFTAMEQYYQDQGRDWERYAMIKARVVAGDKAQGAQLMAMLRPFVYRKYIDFSAFESLRDMKEMINREVRRKGMEQNVKLGSGGIREVEFIAQAFQLIRGGRDTRLQQRELLNILPLLPDAVGMPESVVTALTDAYTFLRNTEHAIQAIADKQTQALPGDELGRARIAFSMGFESWDVFNNQLEKHREDVRSQFAIVVAPAAPEASEQAESRTEWLALWEQEQDESALAVFLARLGFDEPEKAAGLLLELRQSRTVQMMQRTGLERLQGVLPVLLDKIAQVENATETLSRVLVLVQAILRRSAYLVLLAENPAAVQQLVRLCSHSAWFGEQLAKQPVLLDELIDPRTLYAPPDKAQLDAELRQQLLRIPQEDTEALMEALRYFKSAHLLKVAASDITGALPLMKVSDYLTWLAEAILASVLEVAWHLMVEKHGNPLRGVGEPSEMDFIVLGYGKLGGIELSYGSDLDLVFIHDCDPNLMTDGAKSIANSVFFTRLGQRIIHILNTFTAGGQLYEVDMRLRPSGNSGLLVSSLKAFADYQRKEAWTWEHQALVRARVVAGSARLAGEFAAVRAEILGRERELAALKADVVEMREKMRSHLGTSETEAEKTGHFNIKQDRGGIVDIEFLVQYQVLAHAHNHPALYHFSDNIRILDAAETAGLLSAADAQTLREAYKAFRELGHRQTLQGQSITVDQAQISDVWAQVAAIWQQQMA